MIDGLKYVDRLSPVVKKRIAVIGALVSLLPLGQPLAIGTGAFLTSAAVMLAAPAKVNAESAVFYFNRGYSKYELEDYSGAIADYSKVIKINSSYASAYTNRGIAKQKLGDMKGACADWRESASLGIENAAQWVRNEC